MHFPSLRKTVGEFLDDPDASPERREKTVANAPFCCSDIIYGDEMMC